MQPSFIDYVRNTARLIAESQGGEVSIDMVRIDLRTHPGPLPAPISSHQWGTIFRGNGWKLVGTRQSRDPQARGRQVKVWRLVA